MTTPDELAPFLAKARLRRGGIVVAIVCAILASVGFLDPAASTGLKLGLAIPFGLLALVFLVVAFRPPSRHPFIRALRDRRHDITWIYLTHHTVNGVVANNYLNLGLIDGKRPALGVGKTGEDELLLRAQALVPHATIGFSPELEAQFKADPRSLRR